MKVVLATGIFPPDIGGPATYVENLARSLTRKGERVTVVTFGTQHSPGEAGIIRVSKAGGPLLRWNRYASALRQHARDADIIYAFSSVSVGMPLFLSHIGGPKRVLRLGGDFLWERYTDRGGELSLRAWYGAKPWFHGAMTGLLKKFDHIVFSTAFQQDLYERYYRHLPLHSVIENAVPTGKPMLHTPHVPLRLLYLGRFVAFKNLPSLIRALPELPDVRLTFVGDGPIAPRLHELAGSLGRGVQECVMFHAPMRGVEKQRLLADHDLLILPSFTDISPNAALEARACGLPVLLTSETGLSTQLADGALLREMNTPQQIVRAVHEALEVYPQLADRAAAPIPERGWDAVAEEHLALFRSLL